MTDPTLATVDDEPWNQPTQRRSFAFKTQEPIAIESALSVGERVMRRIPIMTPTGHAQFVYEMHGHTTSEHVCQCGARCTLVCWTELEYAPKDPTAQKYKRDYRVVRDVELCNTCSNKLKGLPLGQRWEVKP